MQRIVGIAILGVGIVLLIWGITSSQSAGSEVSKVFTGTPTNKAIYLIIGGLVGTIVGAGIAFISWRRRE